MVIFVGVISWVVFFWFIVVVVKFVFGIIVMVIWLFEVFWKMVVGLFEISGFGNICKFEMGIVCIFFAGGIVFWINWIFCCLINSCWVGVCFCILKFVVWLLVIWYIIWGLGVFVLLGGGICGVGRISLLFGVEGLRFGSSNCFIRLDLLEVGWVIFVFVCCGWICICICCGCWICICICCGGGVGECCCCCCFFIDSIWLIVGGGFCDWGVEEDDMVVGIWLLVVGIGDGEEDGVMFGCLVSWIVWLVGRVVGLVRIIWWMVGV